MNPPDDELDGLRRAVDLEIYDFHDGLVVYDPAGDRVHFLNPTATLLFELADGERGADEIARLVGSAFGLPETPASEVRAGLRELRYEGLLR